MICLVMLLSAVGTFGVVSSKDSDGSGDDATGYVPGELIIKFDDTTGPDSVKKAKDDLKAKEIDAFGSIGAKHWKLGKGVSVEDALDGIEKGKEEYGIEYAEPNYIVHADDLPAAAYRGGLWGMHNIGQTGGTVDADIDALEMWQSYTDASNIVVGVIDSGIDYENVNLQSSIWANEADPIDGSDNDNNGKVDDYRGWDFVGNDNDPMDDYGHGTHVSGTIGGDGDSSSAGVAGVCWAVKLMPLKFLNSGGSGSTTAAISAIEYAASFKDANGNTLVRITSNSWGGGAKSKALETAIKNSGALFIASAGNSGSSTVQYPAGYTCSNIISVAATDHNDALASFSNYGSVWVDLGAPGVDVLSCVLEDGYAVKSGTSMAAPHVTGVAALLMAKNTGWTVAQVKTKLMDSGDALSSLNGKTVSGKRLNAASALGGSALPSDSTAPSDTTDLAASSPTETSMDLAWTAPGEDGSTGTAWAYDVRYSKSTITDGTWAAATLVSLEPGPLGPGSTQSMTVTGLDDSTTYYFALRTLDEVGNPSDLSNVASGTTKAAVYKTFKTTDTGGYIGRHAFAYDNNGDAGFAYKVGLTLELMYAKLDRSAGTWTIETAATGVGGGGLDIAFDSDNNPGIIFYSEEAVKFAHYDGSTWTVTQLEARKCYNDYCSIGYSGSFFGMTYDLTGTAGGLVYRTYDGTTWTKTVVDSKAGARYNAIDFDSDGFPGIAYSDDHYGNDNWLDCIMYAHWDGTTWSIDEADGGTEAFGVFAEMAFGPDDIPRLVHSNSDLGIRYLAWDPTTEVWDLSTIGGEAMGGYTGVTVSTSNVPYVMFHRPDGGVYVAYNDGSGWTIETVALKTSTGRGMYVDYFDGTTIEHVGVSYVNSGTLTFKEKTL